MGSKHRFERQGGLALIALMGPLAVAVLGCRGEVSEDPPILPIRNMYDQERLNPQSYTEFFADKRTMRNPVAGTQSREFYEPSEEIATGWRDDNLGYVMTLPVAVVQRTGGMMTMLGRGQERYGIYCGPCHDATGGGKGMVAKAPNGFPPLPSFHDARLRQMPDGQVFATISNGVRNMPAYSAQIPVSDRWAIVAYVRALQLSQASFTEPNK